jgi:CheY-like chemotaxis protein
VPIIIVSANLYDNHPEKIKASQCQAFVAKPVSELELVSVLGRFLNIEWINATIKPDDLPELFGPEATESVTDLPDILRSTLYPLIRIGHIQGILDTLTEHVLHEPSHEILVTELRSIALRLDFETLLDLTKPDEEEL